MYLINSMVTKLSICVYACARFTMLTLQVSNFYKLSLTPRHSKIWQTGDFLWLLAKPVVNKNKHTKGGVAVREETLDLLFESGPQTSVREVILIFLCMRVLS